eukprot:GHRR01015140.1.p1 GENE.GHRR01015140.1~~GHRR01015140.1.p1  ORF type:complete len:242 (+),score=85.93 GHRR01015140.1:1122-1847(+)
MHQLHQYVQYSTQVLQVTPVIHSNGSGSHSSSNEAGIHFLSGNNSSSSSNSHPSNSTSNDDGAHSSSQQRPKWLIQTMHMGPEGLPQTQPHTQVQVRDTNTCAVVALSPKAMVSSTYLSGFAFSMCGICGQRRLNWFTFFAAAAAAACSTWSLHQTLNHSLVNTHQCAERHRIQLECSSVLQMQEFDAVVVANGHYNEPNLPVVEGADSWSGLQLHSHNYRIPEQFAGQTVVVVGASNSGV